MSGFGGQSTRPIMRDIVPYPSFAELKFRDLSRTMVNLLAAPKAVGEVRHVDRAPIEAECADFLCLLRAASARFREPFMTAASPGIIASAMLNEHYASYRDYVMAVAEALRVEYEYVVAAGCVLVAGVIDTTTNYVEHPEVIADRLERAAEAVGDPHRVLAGTDCGFDTAAGLGEVAQEVVWKKLEALRAGADLATRRLF